MKRDLEHRLRESARASQRDVPTHVLPNVRARLELEAPIERASRPRRTFPTLRVAAAAVFVASLSVGAWFAATTRSTKDVQSSRTASSTSVRASASVLSLPSHGFAWATHAGAPLSREWAGIKRDSWAIVEGLKRELPPLVLRD